MALELEHLFDMTVFLAEPLDLGKTPRGIRQILAGTGGHFEGERLRGEILPGGTDWFLIRPDDVGELDVRMTLETDDGALIYVQSKGFFNFEPAGKKRVFSGSANPSEYYLRERTLLETGSERYAWLNSIVAVGSGWYVPGEVGMSVYALR
jgi:hypothetical protein